jgi:hypothetical protein
MIASCGALICTAVLEAMLQRHCQCGIICCSFYFMQLTQVAVTEPLIPTSYPPQGDSSAYLL